MQIQHLVNIEESLPPKLLERVKENSYSITIDEESKNEKSMYDTYNSLLTSDSKQLSSINQTEELNKKVIDELTDQKHK
jgi:hypothetical protein